MTYTVGRIAVDLGRVLGKAVVAGIGMEIARVLGSRLHKRYGAKVDKDDSAKEPATSGDVERLRRENEELRKRMDDMRAQMEARAK